ncbi:MAG: histidine kinase, partial [Rhizobacter sp.]|nr:histidine kinase [Rhizobacter sp.]
SETDLSRLVTRVVTVIAQISGATGVCLLFRDTLADGSPGEWELAAAAREGTPAVAMRLPPSAAAGYGFTPSLVRYALRSLQPELIHDLAHDPRFAHDVGAHDLAAHDVTPHDVPNGSVMLLPVLSKGQPRALLLLDNRLAAHFFTAAHLDTLSLVTGQLSISLENALLYRSLEQRVVDRTRELQEAASALMLRNRALEASTNGVSIVEAIAPDYPLIYLNPMFEAITGYGARELMGRSMRVLHRDDRQQPGIAVMADAVRRLSSCHVLIRNYRKTGEMFWNDLSIAPVRDARGTVTHFVGITVDVTDRIEAAAAMRARTERLKAVFELSPDGFVVLDASQRVITVNPAFEGMTGLSEASLLGVDLAEFERRLAALGDGDVSHPWGGHGAGMLRLRQPKPAMLMRRTRRVTDSSLDTVMYFRDVTREVEIDRMKSEFLATAAHELRTPMTSVYGFTELLLNRRLSAAVRNDMLETIHKQTGALTALLNELLDLARIESGGRAEFSFKLQPLQPVLHQAVSRLMMPGDARPVTVALPARPVWVRIDAEKLMLAVTNALSNAYKYSHSGPIELDLADSPSGQRVGIRVTDHGIGMEPHQLVRLFERFFRVDPSDAVRGTGLGTNIMKEIVELHGGEVQVTSEPGLGTRVVLWLPRFEAGANDAAEDLPVANARPRPL